MSAAGEADAAVWVRARQTQGPRGVREAREPKR